jgi:NRAMP (natural resistance-associated macrophage protein)-like metal ion transporter
MAPVTRDGWAAGDDEEQGPSGLPTIPRTENLPSEGSVTEAIEREPNPVKRFLKVLGPGFITGASDDDPSGIGTYAVAGAQLGTGILWTALVTFPLMTTIQFVCAKIGMVSGKGLAGVLREHYPRWLLYPAVVALLVANTINLGADIGAVAAAVNLLVPVPTAWFIVPVTLVILGLQVFASYRLIAKVFKWLCLALLAYVGSSLLSKPVWGEVLRGTFVPSVTTDNTFVTTLVAILGTTISPYLFFWQATHEVEAEVSMGRRRLWERRGASDEELKYAALDTNIGMFFSNAVMYFIILATAATLFKAGKHDIQSATDAAEALRPLAGNLSAVLLAVGLVGAGFLAIPVLSASAAYALSEAFGWRYGLDENPGRAKQFYGVIAVAMLVGMAMNFVGIDPISALFWTAVINGVLAVPLMVLIMLVANNKKVMGERTNNRWTNLLGWLTTAAMAAAAVAMFATWGS